MGATGFHPARSEGLDNWLLFTSDWSGNFLKPLEVLNAIHRSKQARSLNLVTLGNCVHHFFEIMDD